jgi:hypothetical protein
MQGFEVFIAMKFPVMVFWVMTLHFTLKMEASWPSEMLLSYYICTRHHNPEDSRLE